MTRHVLVVMLCVAAPACAQLAPPLENLFRQAVAAQKAGRLLEAEKALREVLAQGGRLPFVYNNLGLVYQQQRAHERAMAQFREAIRLDPNYPAPRIALGASLLALGRAEEAVTELESAVRIAPREPLARLHLARAYERRGDPLAALDQWRSLVELAPGEPEHLYQLGRAYMRLSTWCLEQLRRSNHRSPRLYQMLGETFQSQGRLELAVQAYQEAARLDPHLPEIHFALATAYLAQGKTAEARQALDRELALVPESFAAQALRRTLDAAGK
ncbi:MAG: tetratricopeptide repeat protein [Bryobacterales bacterium]|nr:tetratricopeptide repeat protein [Bryobacteraceae bacterium]MDW8352938.1 tetratricopeptide repeat protein [Bryobacterales bacterium]